MKVRHAFVNLHPDEADGTETRPSDWNADHVIDGIRSLLAADTTYFVRTPGNDSSDGLTIATAFATPQRALNQLLSIDRNSFQVFIDIGAGAWSGGPYIIPTTVGEGYTNVTIRGAGSALTSISLWAGFTANLSITGLTITNAMGDGFAGIYVGEHAELIIESDVIFASPASYDIFAYDFGAVTSNKPFSISGNKQAFFFGDFYGRFHSLNGDTITMVGPPGFVQCMFHLIDHMQADLAGSAISGAYSGILYSLNGSNAGITGTLATVAAGAFAVDAVNAQATAKEIDSFGVPNTQTSATYTVLEADRTIIANRAGTVTLTLPAAASHPGRQLTVKTIQAQTVVSVSNNVVPLIGGAASTPILAATAGKWAILQSDATNWIIMAAN